MSPKWPSQTGLNGKFKSSIMVILSVLMTLTPSGLSWAQISDQLSRDMGTIRKQKTNAEEMARLLKEAHNKKIISDESLRQGERLYIDAQAAFDDWITKLKSDLTADRKSNTDQDKEIIQDAAGKGEKFTAYVDKLLYGQDRSAAAIAVFVVPLVKAGLEIVREWRNASQQKREGLIKELEKLRWKSFREIT